MSPHPRHRRAAALALGVGCVLLGVACISKYDDLDVADEEPRRYLLPVVTSRLTVAEALGDNDFAGTLTVDAAGDYELARAETVIEQSVLGAFDLPAIPFFLADTAVVIDVAAFGLGVPVTRIDFAAALLVVTLPNPFDEPVTVRLRADNFLRGDTALVTAATIPAGGVLERALDFAGGSFVIGEGGTVSGGYDARLPDGRRVRLGLGTVVLTEFVPTYVEGVAADVSLPLGRFTVPTDFLRSFEPGRARVDSASVALVVLNDLSADVSARATATFAVLRDGRRLNFSTPFADGVRLQPAAGDEPARTDFVLDGTNSDLLSALLNFPDSVVFSIEATLNPGGAPRPYRVRADDSVTVAYRAEVPLRVAFDAFVSADTFLLPDLGELERISAAAVRLTTANRIPVGATVEAFLLDAAGARIAPLLGAAAQVVRPAAYDARVREVTAAAFDTTTVALDPSAIPLLSSADRAELVVSLDTDARDAAFVQLRPDHTLSFSLGLDVILERE